MVLALGALAQTTRLAVFRVLVKRAPRALSAADMATELKVKPSSLSLPLMRLKRAGLITVAGEAPVVYALDSKRVRALARLFEPRGG
ncbi:MAG: ArsR/SmtB family transcription factor [Hyphomonadaceae bacterium]